MVLNESNVSDQIIYTDAGAVLQSNTLEVQEEETVKENKVKSEMMNFELDWTNVATDTVQKLNAKEYLTSSEWSQLVSEIVRQFQKTSKQIDVSTIASISIRIANNLTLSITKSRKMESTSKSRAARKNLLNRSETA